MRSQTKFRFIGLAIVISLLLITLAPGSVAQARSRRQLPQPIEIGVTVSGNAHQTPEGQVSLHGTVTCSESTDVNLVIRVTQEQAENPLVRGLERVTVACSPGAPVPYSIIVSPVGFATFARGFAYVDVVRATACGEGSCDVVLLSKRVWVRHHTEPVVQPVQP